MKKKEIVNMNDLFEKLKHVVEQPYDNRKEAIVTNSSENEEIKLDLIILRQIKTRMIIYFFLTIAVVVVIIVLI